MKSTKTSPATGVPLGATVPASAFAVDDALADPGALLLLLGELEAEDEAATCVTTVVVCGGTVVPGTVVAATVLTGFAVTPLGKLCVTVIAAIVLGAFVVPGIVVVYVISCPSEFEGMAPPTPVPVNCVGTESVAVFGLEDGEEL